MTPLNAFQRMDPSDPTETAQELLRAILVRAQFVPGVRYALGWRGIRQSVAGPVEGWTARIEGAAGVYGLCFAGMEEAPGWMLASFNLCYFPDADESLVENCSLQAAAWTQRPDYLPLVRDFQGNEEFVSLFSAGTVFLAADPADAAMYLGLESLTIQRSRAIDGVRLERDGKMAQVISPGGCDRVFPAYEVVQRFFDVLAASLSFHLEEPPQWLSERRFPGMEIVYSRKGDIREIPAADIDRIFVGLGYGPGRFEVLSSVLANKMQSMPSKSELIWLPADPVPAGYINRNWWNACHTRNCKTLDKKTLGIDERPPLIILSGFLGAGKTSFLQHFIEYQTQRSRFVAIIQNEIGEVGLDGKLLDYNVTEIDEGCVCCSLAGNLKRAVQGILSRFQPDCIVLETTGAANPLNLIDEIGELETLVRYDCTVTVVDGLNLDYTLSHFSIAADQIRAAGVLLLNKCDLISVSRQNDVRGQLRKINPSAVILTATGGDVNPALLFDMGENRKEGVRPLSYEKSVLPGFNTHMHDGLWCSTLAIPAPLDHGKFLEVVKALPATVFRIKGIVEFSDSSQPMLFQYVAGRYDISQFPFSPVKDRFLNIIAQGEKTTLAVMLQGSGLADLT